MKEIQLIKTTPEELYNGFEEIVKDLEQRLNVSFQQKETEQFLTREETAEMLRIDKSTLWLWTKKGKLKAYGIGNRVYYKRSEVYNAIVELKY